MNSRREAIPLAVRPMWIQRRPRRLKAHPRVPPGRSGIVVGPLVDAIEADLDDLLPVSHPLCDLAYGRGLGKLGASK